MFANSLVFFGLASSVMANIYLTSPVASTSWAAGEVATITWEDISKDSTYSLEDFGEAEVSISVGSATSQTKLYIISPNVNFASTASIEFTVDGSIGPDDDNYFIRVDSNTLKSTVNPQYPEQAFSAKFALTNMNGAFSAEVQSQIAGQATAPLGGSTATKTGAATTSSAKTSSTGTSTRNTALSATGTSEEDSTDGAFSLSSNVWFGLALGAMAAFAL